MNKIIILSFLILAFISCRSPEKEIDKLGIAKQYFKILDNSDYSKISDLVADELTTIEGEYINTYSKIDYLEFLKWDSVFDPSYQVIEIEQKNGIVKGKISKMDKRISFLHERPFITNQIIKFQNGKITSIETEYVNFNEAIWEKNKNGLINWIDKNHPELNGFIYDQTESGGIKFLKAIELYNNKE